MTPLTKGIKVYINKDEFDLLKDKPGFLSCDNYPDEYKEIEEKGELGRFLFFRFIGKTVI